MRIARMNLLTGKENVMDLPVTMEQINDWQSGTLIQFAMPELTAEQREFLITGMTPEEQAEVFADD